ncbi:hypothetical protein ACCO45_013312 [Purpureocillium lilacinum]|uniref:Uncharacterized protein n=1 Tax=Purpureocillium lilacinum TaxID=33203 RepID=A0ACC4DCQ1_PURLI
MVIGNIYVIAAVSVVGGGLFGFDISSLAPTAPPFNDKPYCSGPTSSKQGGITSSMAAGSWLGALISGPVSDRMGRKYSIMLGCIVWMIGSAIICASQNIGMLVVGRIINDLAPSKRGRLIGMQQWAITWGILIMYYISYGCSHIGKQNAQEYSTSSFRIPWGLQMIPAVFLFFMMMLLPESPRWLARKDRWEDCRDVLTLVHGKGDPNHPFVAFELQDIKDMCEFERRHSDVTYLDLFKKSMLNRTFIGLFTQIWSQLTGMNVMMYYIANIFSMAGYSGNAGLLSSSITYVVNVLMTIPALLWVDRWGRRPTLMIGSIFMTIWMFAAAGILAKYGVIVPGGIDGVAAQSMKLSGAPAKALIAVTYLFVASFAPTWGPVSWTYPPELYPLRLRGKGCALATSANWAFNTALGEFVPPAFANIKWRTYLIFGIFNVAALFHVYFVFPETAGKTLEETEAMFEDPNGIKYLGTPAWKTGVVTASTSRVERGDLEGAKKAVDRMEGHEEEKPAAPAAA